MAGQKGARERILQATMGLIREQGAARITVRKVAEQAGVGLGLINYHFGSKQELLMEAARALLGEEAEAGRGLTDPHLDPATRVRRSLRQRLRPLEVDRGWAQLMAQRELMAGETAAVEALMSPLRELLAGERSEVELRMLALILWSMPLLLCGHPGALGGFLGLDLDDWAGRETAMDVLAGLCLARGVRNGEREE
jgi:AcrR family transcriptional regulator